MHCIHCGAGTPQDARFCAGCGRPVGAAGSPGPSTSSSILLTVLLVVAGVLGAVMITGIVAAIAIPNLLNAIDRGKQKRTMADIRSIGIAIESYGIDHNTYPVARDIDELAGLIEPVYIRHLPRHDGWNWPFRVSSVVTSYELVSPGKDGKLSGCESGPTLSFNADVCFADGEFTQWPEGAQR